MTQPHQRYTYYVQIRSRKNFGYRDTKEAYHVSRNTLQPSGKKRLLADHCTSRHSQLLYFYIVPFVSPAHLVPFICEVD